MTSLQTRSRRGAKRIGMLEGLSLTGYLKLLDWSSRLLRSRKRGVSRDLSADAPPAFFSDPSHQVPNTARAMFCPFDAARRLAAGCTVERQHGKTADALL